MIEEVFEKLKRILHVAFPNSPIPENILELHYGKLEEWDSLGNFALLMLVEQEFGLEFTMKELSEIKSIEQIVERLKQN